MLLAAALALPLAACGNGSNVSSSGGNSQEDSNSNSSSTGTEYKTIQLNEAVATEDFKFSLIDVEFSGKSSEIGTGYTVEIMDSDQELLRCDYTISYIGKESIHSSPVAMSALYGDGYTLRDGRQYILSPDGELKETYRYTGNSETAVSMNFEPLTDDIYNGYGFMEVPKAV